VDKFKDYDNDALAALLAEKMAAFFALRDNESFGSEEDIQAGEALFAEIEEIQAETAEREEAAQALAARASALKDAFSTAPGEDDADDDAADDDPDADDPDAEDDDDEEPEPVAEPTAAVKAPAAATRQKVAAKTKRPAPPVTDGGPVTITAAADVQGFATGSRLDGLANLGQAVVNRMSGFSAPTGDGTTEDLRKFGVASINLDFPKELTIDRGSDDMEVLAYAQSEARLPGNSLTAAAGWCAPSETLYDLCAQETAEGILSVPEVNVKRGGIKYTTGPDFSTIYSGVGFLQTEAQAISGTSKACYEVPCPSFTDVRLDAIGICIKVPILLNSAYPEVTQRIMSGSLIAHQHKVNASVISRMVTLAGPANTYVDFGGTAQNTLASLEYQADRLRQKYVLSMSQSMEVVLPFWIKGAIRSDLSLRTGTDVQAVTDQMINAHFAARKLNVQFVYDWQALADPATTEGYPATYQALMYPAGTFIKGTTDVINVSAVYDAASLAVNTYTGLFFEEGLLVAKMCNEATLLTLAICNSGKTGIANIAACGTGV
jgi:hypothetical protein